MSTPIPYSIAFSDGQHVHYRTYIGHTDWTIEQAIIRSDLLIAFPDIDLKQQRVGIFNQLVGLNQLLSANDRIEIYQAITFDAKQDRYQRVAQSRTARA